jgi:hypothetical protein
MPLLYRSNGPPRVLIARKFVNAGGRSADIVHSRKATLMESMRSADQKVSSPTRCCFAWQAVRSGTAERRSGRPVSSLLHHRFRSGVTRTPQDHVWRAWNYRRLVPVVQAGSDPGNADARVFAPMDN